MRVFTYALSLIVAATFVIGCSKETAPSAPKQEVVELKTTTVTPSVHPMEPVKEKAATEEHKHVPPHGGALIAIEGHVGHLEVVLDSATGTLTLYALDGELENPVRLNSIGFDVRIAAEGKDEKTLTLKPVENVLTGETGNSTSQYAVQSDDLKGITAFKGVIPELSFRGLELADLAFSYPEGNEVSAPGGELK